MRPRLILEMPIFTGSPGPGRKAARASGAPLLVWTRLVGVISKTGKLILPKATARWVLKYLMVHRTWIFRRPQWCESTFCLGTWYIVRGALAVLSAGPVRPRTAHCREKVLTRSASITRSLELSVTSVLFWWLNARRPKCSVPLKLQRRVFLVIRFSGPRAL